MILVQMTGTVVKNVELQLGAIGCCGEKECQQIYQVINFLIELAVVLVGIFYCYIMSVCDRLLERETHFVLISIILFHCIKKDLPNFLRFS